MATSARIQEVILKLLSDDQQHSVQDIKSYLADSGVGEYSEGQFAGSINTLQRNGRIKKVERGIYIIQRNEEGSVKMRTCFVVSPIGDAGSDIRNKADKLFKYIIKPVCESCGFDAVRVDQMHDAGSITQTILDSLETADLVIADISGLNPNVFYEIGFRTRTRKPIIHLKAQGEKLPFDINTIRAFDYDLTDLDSVDEVKSRLEQTIGTFNFVDLNDVVESDTEVMQENATASMLPLLYQISDAIVDLHEEVKSHNNDIIQTIIKAMQNSQPQMSPEAAMQSQLMGALIQNPEGLMKLAEMVDKFPSQTNNKRFKP